MIYLVIGVCLLVGSLCCTWFMLMLCRMASVHTENHSLADEEFLKSIRHLPLWQQEEILDQRENCK